MIQNKLYIILITAWGKDRLYGLGLGKQYESVRGQVITRAEPHSVANMRVA